MAKPKSEGFPYCQQDTDTFFDPKIRTLIARFGCDGYAVWDYIKQAAYREHGYYVEWDDDRRELASADLYISVEKLGMIEAYLLKRSLLLSKSFNGITVLTSHGIQARFQKMAKETKRTYIFRKDIWVLSEAETLGFIFHTLEKNNSGIKADNSGINTLNSGIMRQKKSKVNKSKEICGEPEQAASPPVIGLPLNDSTEHPIYQSDIEEWENLYPSVDVIQEIRKMRGWLLSNPERRKTKRGINRFINNWLSREQDKGHGVKVTAAKGTNKFTNYSQRQYDYKDIERMAAERLKNATI